MRRSQNRNDTSTLRPFWSTKTKNRSETTAPAMTRGFLAHGGTELVDIDTRLGKQVAHAAAVLVEHGLQQMRGLNKLMIAPERSALGVTEGQLELGR